MRLLFVTHLLPYPPTDGGRIATFNAIKYLARNHEVLVASLAEPAEEPHVEALRRYCSAVEVVYTEPWRRYPRSLRALAGAIPGTASLYYDPRLARSIRGILSRHAVDLVVLEHLNAAAYRSAARGIPVVLREHNVEFQVWERQAEHASNPLSRAVFAAAAWRIRRYEAAVAADCSRCIAISAADAALLRSVSPRAHVTAVPAGIDCAYFSPCGTGESVAPFSMLLVGSFAWKPKQHNLAVLATAIFPRIRAVLPRATLTVVGKGIPSALRRRVEAQGVLVAGEVPDVRPFLRRAALVLNYVEVGGGMPVKLLEAMAMRKAVLANVLGSAGLDVVPGRDLCVAVSADEFAASARRLLCDAAARERLAAYGHHCVTRNYSCVAVTARYEQVYREVLAGRPPVGLTLARQPA